MKRGEICQCAASARLQLHHLSFVTCIYDLVKEVRAQNATFSSSESIRDHERTVSTVTNGEMPRREESKRELTSQSVKVSTQTSHLQWVKSKNNRDNRGRFTVEIFLRSFTHNPAFRPLILILSISDLSNPGIFSIGPVGVDSIVEALIFGDCLRLFFPRCALAHYFLVTGKSLQSPRQHILSSRM